MIRDALEEYTWRSESMLAAELDADGAVVRANRALELLAAGGMVGRAFAELVAEPQREAFERRLASAEAEWRPATFALKAGAGEGAADRRVWLRRAGDGLVVVAEPAAGEQDRLVAKVLELNDELVSAHRDLVGQREELRHALQRIQDLEAISAAGLNNLTLDELLPAVLRIIADAAGAERAVLLLRDVYGDLVGRAAVGVPADVVAGIRVPIGVGVAGGIAAENRPRIIPDLSQVDVHSAYLREGARSMAGVPLTLEGEVIGVLHVSSDELDRFGDEDLNLLVPAAERAALAIGRARVVERERRVAETLQRALLPQTLPAVPGLEMAASFTPGAGVEVGGDWYDALPLPDGELLVAIGDVAGKGLRAATVMGELRAGLRAYAIEGWTPMETLARLNRLAERSFQMATVFLMHVDPATGAMQFASAGHLPALVVEADGRASFLRGGASTPLLAFREDVEPGRAELASGARVVLYTDGLVERRTEPIDDSLERLRSAAEGFRGGARELCEHVVEAMRPDGGVHDDIAVFVLARAA
jgi:hypothetical protein